MPENEEDSLDWSENQARPRRRQLALDLVLIGGLLVLTGLLVLIIFWWRGWRL